MSYSGTVTLANLKLQTANGMGFIDLSTALAPKPYDTYRLILQDSAGKKAIGSVYYKSTDTPFVNMTYAAAGSTGITVADNSNLDYATGNFFGGVLATIPDYTPSAEVVLDTKHDGSNGRTFSIQTNGKLRLTINANNYDSTVATGLTDGTRHFLSYSVTRETATVDGSVRFEVDGVTLGTAVSITAGAPATVSNAVAQYVLGTSAKREAGIASKFYSYNRALTAAEVDTLFQSGVADADQYGSQTAKYSCTTNFSGWAVNTATNTGGQLTFITDAATWQRAYANVLSALTYNGKNFRLQYEITSNDAVGITRFYLLADDTNKINHADIELDTSVGVHDYYFTCNPNGLAQALMFYLEGQITAGSMVVDNVYLWETGATLDLEPAGIEAASWQDSSTNNLDGAYPAAGASPYPSGNGVRITSVMGGSTFNWEQIESGFNTADASGYTYTIEPHVGWKRRRGIRRYRDANGIERVIYY